MRSTSNISVYGIFRSTNDLKRCMEKLEQAGFRDADVAALYHENPGTKDFSHRRTNKAPQGAVRGGVAGAIIGGILAWLVHAGIIATAGFTALAASSGLIAILAGLGAGGVLGALLGAAIGSARPAYEAQRFEGRVRGGGHLVSVHCDDNRWARTAEKIVKEMGGIDVSRAHEAPADYANSDRPMAR